MIGYTLQQKKDEFLRHLGDFNDIPLSQQRIPYFIRIQDGKIISIEENLNTQFN